jgi:hypothetical protein
MASSVAIDPSEVKPRRKRKALFALIVVDSLTPWPT